MSDVAPRALLGGRTPSSFLRRHWQKRPLLVRQAIAGFRGLLPKSRLLALAARDDVESRIVVREGARWELIHGPIRAAQIRALPARNWTLLVQGVNLHLRQADALLHRFAFVPYARLDDLMVSLAAPGGGVGPHFDSYDVFLLQGEGRRRWRISRQRDLTLEPSLPLQILARFRPRAEWVLAPGDMLYLPPACAHDGVAVDACTTYSIGFRAPAAQELGVAFVDWLRDRLALQGRYADPDLASTVEPARIGAAMQKQCVDMLARIRWDAAIVRRFLGCYLTEPAPNVFFVPPARPLDDKAFAVAARRRGVRLDGRTRLLYDSRDVFLNGEPITCAAGVAATLRRLANRRALAGADIERGAMAALIYRWYCDGFLHLD